MPQLSWVILVRSSSPETYNEHPSFFFSVTNGLIYCILSGGWEGQAQFKMTFLHGGAIELGQHLFKLASNGEFMQNLASSAFIEDPGMFSQMRGTLHLHFLGSSISIAVITVMLPQPLALLLHRMAPLPTATPHLA